jgi:hypothetical protein
MGEIWKNSNRLRAIATRCDFRLRPWEQDVGGSSPLAPTKFNIAEQLEIGGGGDRDADGGKRIGALIDNGIVDGSMYAPR